MQMLEDDVMVRQKMLKYLTAFHVKGLSFDHSVWYDKKSFNIKNFLVHFDSSSTGSSWETSLLQRN